MVSRRKTVGGRNFNVLGTQLTGLKWAFLALSIGSVVYAGYLMLTAKHGIEQIINAVAIQVGTTVANPDMTEYDGDRLVWRLQADSAKEQETKVLLKNPVIDLFAENGDKMPIRAHQGIYDKTNKVMHFKGNVLAGYQTWDLSSETLDYFDEKGEVIVADTFVLKQEGMRISGKDLRIFRTEEKVQVLQGVHMSIEENQ